MFTQHYSVHDATVWCRILESPSPHPIKSLSAVPVASVSAGDAHSLVLSSAGHLYTFGDGRHGKLCLDTDTITNHFSPGFVQRFRGEKSIENFYFFDMSFPYLQKLQ